MMHGVRSAAKYGFRLVIFLRITSDPDDGNRDDP
jgi:hypothetical protein